MKSYLAVGGGVILLGFGGNRFTASAAEGYFPFVIRVGVRLLFFYLVLGVGVQLANQWNAALTAACKPVITAVPLISSYYVPPSKIMTTVCSGSISASDMLDFVGLAVVFAIMTIGIPHTVSSLVGGSIGLALAHAFEAAYIARTIVSPITSGLKKIHDGISGFAKGSSTGAGDGVQSATQDILRQHQREKSADASANAATKVLNPFNGQPPGYNYRPPDGSNPRGPQLPPPPNNGSGGRCFARIPARQARTVHARYSRRRHRNSERQWKGRLLTFLTACGRRARRRFQPPPALRALCSIPPRRSWRIASLRHGGIAWLRARSLVAELCSASSLFPLVLSVL